MATEDHKFFRFREFIPPRRWRRKGVPRMRAAVRDPEANLLRTIIFLVTARRESHGEDQVWNESSISLNQS
jgi:hypothetical protein